MNLVITDMDMDYDLKVIGVSVIVENVGGPELAEFGRPNVSGVIDDRLNEPTSPPPTLLLGDTEFLD
ncbi:hypothetical protein DERP_001920 [Dermatophagoides pteronyssinus]|uniref:Uncharacterized protein n=1 Tax=Dermatophagoides pteronyssinus TaxID=6956 RepID=A0ABQ8JCE8_DERPT|nr:hypothetical protein DERP_001920 [Dermatophagoides pteronyssinus]